MALVQETVITLYREEMASLYGYVSRRTAGNRALSEDIVQETFLRAVRSWRAYGVPATPQAWLRRVAHNLLMSHFRKHRPESLEDHKIALEGDSRTDLPSDVTLVNWGLSRLQEDQADLIEAFHFDGKSVAEIAREMEISTRAAEGRLYRARRALRDLLGPHTEDSEKRNAGPTPSRP